MAKLPPIYLPPRDEDAPKPRSKEARTRGADNEAYLNRPTIDTPGFSMPKTRRWRQVKQDPQHRAELIAEAYSMAMAGCTDYEIAQSFGVTPSTLWRWRQEDKRLDEVLTIGTDIANQRVTASLYHKAMGYSFNAVKIMNVDGEIVKVPYVEHIPPDNTAMVFWLKNKAGWRDQIDVEDVTPPSANTDIRQLAMAMLLVLRQGMNESGKTIDLDAVQQQAKELTK